MRGAQWTAAGAVGLAVVAGSAVAAAVTLTPEGGPPDSSYVAEVACDAEPSVVTRPLDAGRPAATLVPVSGSEASPGVWRYDLQAGERDQLVASVCGDDIQRSRYDVELPVLLPGPTVDAFPDWDPALEGSTVVGTDCDGPGPAEVVFTADGGFSETVSRPVDAYGDWESELPDAAPSGFVDVNATCGSVVYRALSLVKADDPPSATTDSAPAGPLPTSSTPPTVPSGTAPPATPIPTAPTFTG